MTDVIKKSLKSHFDSKLVDELIAAYEEAKVNYYLGGHRLSAVEGGRFCEAAFRMLEELTTGSFTPLGKQLDTGKLVNQLASLPGAKFSRSVAIHIPRALRVIYDVRNNRDTAHLADGIDPNIQDATMVISNLNWVAAEFVRLYHGVSPAVAQRLIDEISIKKVPVIQEFDGHPRVLRVDLRAGEMVLVLLYQVGSSGATIGDLTGWVRPSMRANLRRTLRALDEKAQVHLVEDKVFITYVGRRLVEENGLLEMT